MVYVACTTTAPNFSSSGVPQRTSNAHRYATQRPSSSAGLPPRIHDNHRSGTTSPSLFCRDGEPGHGYEAFAAVKAKPAIGRSRNSDECGSEQGADRP